MVTAAPPRWKPGRTYGHTEYMVFLCCCSSLSKVSDLAHWKSAGKGLAKVPPASVLMQQRARHQFPGAQHLSGNRGSGSPAVPRVRVKGRSGLTCPLLTPQHWSHTSLCCCLIYFRLIHKLSFRLMSMFGAFNSLPMREKGRAQAASLTSHLIPHLPQLFPPVPAPFKPVLPPL